jgi:hypothetical protein
LCETLSSTPSFPTVSGIPAIPDLTELLNQVEGRDEADVALPQETFLPVVDQFPFGSPGMPIPDKPEGSLTFKSWHATSSNLLWAPFCSELEWNFTQWAKMHGGSSTAVSQLLGIPGVLFQVSIN